MRRTLIDRMVDEAIKALHISIEIKAEYVLSDILTEIIKERISNDALIESKKYTPYIYDRQIKPRVKNKIKFLTR